VFCIFLIWSGHALFLFSLGATGALSKSADYSKLPTVSLFAPAVKSCNRLFFALLLSCFALIFLRCRATQTKLSSVMPTTSFAHRMNFHKAGPLQRDEIRGFEQMSNKVKQIYAKKVYKCIYLSTSNRFENGEMADSGQYEKMISKLTKFKTC